jgi:exodeoxyribonuclease VII large subunit
MAQHLDALALRLRRAQALDRLDKARRLRADGDRLRAAFAARLRLSAEVDRARRQRLADLGRRMALSVSAAGERRAARLSALAQVLGGLSYRSVLTRGFALVRDREGRPVRAAAGLAPPALISLEFADGQVRAEVTDAETPRVRSRPVKPAGKPPGPQGSLF